MERHTRLAGILLGVIGLVAFFGSGASSVTAFIPVVLGLALVGCAELVRRDESKRAAAMHAAAGLTLLGILGSGSRMPSAFGDDDVSGWAVGANIAVLVVLIPLLVLFVQSFRAARAARAGTPA